MREPPSAVLKHLFGSIKNQCKTVTKTKWVGQEGGHSVPVPVSHPLQPLQPQPTRTPQPVYSSAQSPDVHTAPFVALNIQKKSGRTPQAPNLQLLCILFSFLHSLGGWRVLGRDDDRSEDNWKLVTRTFILSTSSLNY